MPCGTPVVVVGILYAIKDLGAAPLQLRLRVATGIPASAGYAKLRAFVES